MYLIIGLKITTDSTRTSQDVFVAMIFLKLLHNSGETTCTVQTISNITHHSFTKSDVCSTVIAILTWINNRSL